MKIHELLAEASAEIGAIGKTRTNTNQGYAFRGVDDVQNAANPVFAKLGIVVVPSVVSAEYGERPSSTGGSLQVARLQVAFNFYGPEGDHIEAITAGEGMDSGDKATNKAMAGAYKYALLQTLCIPTEDTAAEDADSESPVAVASVPDPTGYVPAASNDDVPIACPECGGDVWDNRDKKRRGEYSRKYPDFTCKNKKTTGCEWAKWTDEKKAS